MVPLADAQLAPTGGEALVHPGEDVVGHVRIGHLLRGDQNGRRSHMQGLQEISPLLYKPLLLNRAQTMLPQDSTAAIIIPEHAAVGILLGSSVGVASINGLGKGKTILISQPGSAQMMPAMDSRDAEVPAKLCQGEPDVVAVSAWRRG